MSVAAGSPPRRIVVVGASLCGLSAAQALREEGFSGEIVLVGDEPERPYDRPPLSKQVLRGRYGPDTTLPCRPDLDLRFRLGTAAAGLDPRARRVVLADGETLAYDRVLIATGTRARPWPGVPAGPLHTLRTRRDAERLGARLAARPRRVVVVGGGFIGCEAAASIRAMGLAVTQVVREPVPLVQALGDAVGTMVAEVAREAGVDLLTDRGIAGIDAAGDEAVVRLDDGRSIETGCVLVALGAVRNVEWLAGAGLAVSDAGVRVDAECRALSPDGRVVPDVFAAGDVAQWPSAIYGGARLAVEHWGNAVAQGRVAARNMAEAGRPLARHDHLPDFWSHLFGLTVKLVGVPDRADRFAVVQGTMRERRFVGIYGAGDRTVAAVSVDSARWLPAYRAAVAEGASFPPFAGALDQPRFEPRPLATA